MSPKEIKSAVAPILSEMIAIRRHLHENPELSFHEVKTAAFISEHLTSWGIQHQTQIGGNGILATVTGELTGNHVIAIRGDMDALPIQETTNLPFASKNDGVMHACGHDVHTTCVLATARVLNELKSKFGGTVLIVFQPAEEVLPGGAKLMMEDGVFNNRQPQHIIGQHVFPELPAGKVGFRSGPYMASTDEIYLTIKGKGGHGAKPDQVIDPVLMSAHVLVALQQVASRWSNPQMPTVLSFGKIIGQGATNIIPSEVRLEGTFRTFSEAWRNEAHDKIRNLITGICESMGGSAEVRIERGYPVLVNDEEFTKQCKAEAIALLGEENVVELDMRTTAEDFAYFAQAYPSCFYRLGTATTIDNSCSLPVHNSGFQVNEDCLSTGIELMSWLTLKSLNT